MPTPPAWKGVGIREPITLVGRHVRLEPLAPLHAPDLYQGGHTPDIWLYLTEPRRLFASVADAAQWVAHVLTDHAAWVRVPFAVIFLATGRAIGRTSDFFETR
jgi:hypothetical protein